MRGSGERGEPAGRRAARAAVAMATLMAGMSLAHALLLGAGLPMDPREAAAAALGGAALGVVVLHRLWPSSAPLRMAGGGRAAVLAWGAFLVLWLPVAVLAYGALLRALGEVLPPQPLLVYFVEPRAPGRVAATALVVCVLGPVAEEIVFRGYVQEAVRAVARPATAVLATAALFGLVHGPRYALPIGLLGVLFGWLRERYGALGPPILAHALHNTATVTLVLVWPGALELLFGGGTR